jgi:PAS domain S-box-containing protein
MLQQTRSIRDASPATSGDGPPTAAGTTMPPAILATFAEQVSDAVVGHSADGVVRIFNPAAEHLFGRTAAEVVGRPFMDLVATEQPAWPYTVQSNGRSAAAALPGMPLDVEFVRSDASLIDAEVRILDLGVAVDGFRLLLLRERAARTRVDAELELLKSIALAMGSADDLQSALTDALAMIGRATGWTAGESWLPCPSAGALVPGSVWLCDQAMMREFVEATRQLTFELGHGLPGRVWRSKGPIWVNDITADPDFVRAEIAQRCGLTTGFAIPVLLGAEVVAVIAFYHTEARGEDAELVELVAAVAAQLGALVRRKQAEDALTRHAEELARSNAELERYAYAASHDLQEPLRMAASYVQLLERRYRDVLDDDAREIIGYAVEGVTRMRQQILDLLTLSEVKRSGDTAAPVDAEAVLRRKIAELAPVIKARGARITWDPLPQISMERAQLGQIFERLLDNALKFCRSDAPRVHVSARPDERGWVFSFQDNGLGIAPEFFDRIFVMFQRLNSRELYPGTGMGLPIVKKIVELNGGRVWVESTPGLGSTFFVSLPAQEPLETAA